MTHIDDPSYCAYIEAVSALNDLRHTIRRVGRLTPELYEQLVDARLAVWKARHEWDEKCHRTQVS